MSTKDISFIANILVVGYKTIDKLQNDIIFNDLIFNLSDSVRNKFIKIEVEYQEDNRFMQIIIEDGLSKPRHEKLYNVSTLEERENPRKEDEVEAKISYALIDAKSSLMWISNHKKKIIVLDLLKKQLNTLDIELKNIYNEKEFVDTLSSLSGISVSAEPSIFIEHNLSSNLINDPLGYNAELATLHFQYKHVRVIDKLKNTIENLISKKDSFKRIIVTGKDKNDIGMNFNTSVFSRRVEFRSLIDENGMFIHGEVFKNLIEQIKNEEKVIQNI